ncbi:hypothetical protein E4U52_008181, partial [Claviceps spartinae]
MAAIMDSEIDLKSLALIIEIQLQDLRCMTKGKHTIDHGPDSEVAAQIMEAEVKNLSSFYADRSMTRSIAHALVTDADAIAAHALQEKQAADDRAFALRDNPQGARRLGQPTTTASSSASHSKDAEDKINQKLAVLTVDEKKYSSAAELSITTTNPSSASKEKSALRRCVACKSVVASTDSVRFDCSHDYCGDCIASLFSAVINDDSGAPKASMRRKRLWSSGVLRTSESQCTDAAASSIDSCRIGEHRNQQLQCTDDSEWRKLHLKNGMSPARDMCTRPWDSKEPIPLDLYKPFLAATLLGTYEAKKLEYGTLDKTYCHVRTCSTFVPPAFVKDDVATCVKCQSKTCTMCKGETHTDDCPADTLTADFLQIATENGWQR